MVDMKTERQHPDWLMPLVQAALRTPVRRPELDPEADRGAYGQLADLSTAMHRAGWWLKISQSHEGQVSLDAGPGYGHPESGLRISGYRVTALALPTAFGTLDELENVISLFWKQVNEYVDARNRLAREAASI